VVSDVDAIEVRPRPCWVAGRPEQGERTSTVRHPYDGTDIADIAVPGADQVRRAVAAATGVAMPTPAARVAALRTAAELVAERAEELAETVTAENGTPLGRAHEQAAAAAAACRFAADEAGRRELDGPFVRQRPRGPGWVVVPAGCPVDEVAAQVAAAVAVGAPVVMAPEGRTPMAALFLGEALAETDLPAGAFSVLPGCADLPLPVTSVAVPESAGAAAVVCPDADLDEAVRRIATFAVRRVIVPAAVATDFVPRLVAAVGRLRTGDPHDPSVDVGPMVDEPSAAAAVAGITGSGGEVLVGGTRTGACVTPTVVRGGSADVAGPVLFVSVVDELADAVAAAAGRRAGVFTPRLDTAVVAGGIDVDELVIGDVPTGLTRTSVRARMLDYTRERVTELRIG
jgi:acyl-CoA reductase-like NAD-dependent aldehyde dehydrogenase